MHLHRALPVCLLLATVSLVTLGPLAGASAVYFCTGPDDHRTCVSDDGVVAWARWHAENCVHVITEHYEWCIDDWGCHPHKCGTTAPGLPLLP